MAAGTLYLNHAGTSWPKPPVVADAVQDAVAGSPMEWPQRFEASHRAISEFFGLRSAEQLLLTPGCTSALAVAIADIALSAGKRVLTSHWEHHALHRPLLKLAAAGVHVEQIPPLLHESRDSPSSIDLEWFEQALSANDVGLVAITAACNVTGELLPFSDVIRLAHERDVMVLIDAAQIVGWVRLDLPRLGADLVAFGGHKGLQGPWGIGGLYLSENAHMDCVSAACALPAAGTAASRQAPRPGYCDVGSVDQVALAGLNAGIELLSSQDMAANLTRARQQIQRIRSGLERFEHLQIFGAYADGMPTLAFGVDGRSSSEVASELAVHGVVVGSGLQCAPLAHETLGTAGSGLVRLSVGVGQSDEEIDEAVGRLQFVLRK